MALGKFAQNCDKLIAESVWVISGNEGNKVIVNETFIAEKLNDWQFVYNGM